jgi:hypothetical protein
MTEVRSTIGDDLFQVLDRLRDTADGRKLRGFAARCCRAWGGHAADARIGPAVAAAEQFAAGRASAAELRAAHREAWRSFDPDVPLNDYGDPNWADIPIMLTHPDAWHAAY